jgi:hypothetical protein
MSEEEQKGKKEPGYEREALLSLQEKVDQIHQAYINLVEKHHFLAARLDAHDLVLGLVAQRTGMDVVEYDQMLRSIIHTAHQKRLERVEKRNPAAAAAVDARETLPEIDQAMLDAMRFDDEGETPLG